MNDKNKNDGISFFVIIIAFAVFWPLGLFLLFYKLGVFNFLRGIGKKADSDVTQRSRMSKYKIMTEGRSAESIEYLANAVGVSYESALRDLQQMVAAGEFGPEAYINYVDKTLVLSQVKKTVSGTSTGAKSAGTAPKAPAKPASTANKKKEKGLYGSIPTWLLIIGIVMLAVGICTLSEAIDTLVWLGIDSYLVSQLLTSLFWFAGGAASLTARSGLKKRANRVKVYSAAVKGRDYISLEELRSMTGVNKKTLQRDLEVMLDKGQLGEAAYIDQGNQVLILKAGANPKAKEEPEPPKDDEDRYRAILREIRQVNDDIPDPEISRRIDEMEDLTARIFKAVQDKPEKLPQIKSFMSYYLPTALKLLRSYADFDSSGADGDNIRTAKADIERILDMLVDGFKKQLDKLYESDAMDISSDIDVLENMLRRDGLSGDGSGFGAASGH